MYDDFVGDLGNELLRRKTVSVVLIAERTDRDVELFVRLGYAAFLSIPFSEGYLIELIGRLS